MADGMDGSATSAKRATMLLLLDSDSSESESSSTDTSDSSDSDSDAKACAYEREFNKLFRIPAKRPKVVGFIEDVVRQYSDHEFRRHFRLARPVAEKLVAEFAVSSMCPSSTHGAVQAKSAETHVLTFICTLKKRFRQLMYLELHTIHWLNKFIISCCILHNLCIDYGDEEPDDDNDDDGAPNAIQWENCTDNHSDKTDEERALHKLGKIKRAKVLTKLLQSDCGK
ncbi:hypothetical protein HPB51_024218 [Rhipicephalus microplus]|uniref:Uncharacterized protein n=1 Tax=Rhipicephalus microplus TaxID=6941 RepID=A0A9J6DWY6_RHIMP|nr:hypothetical protein HPB51_024218 [Rhipicephalus microplus]